MLKSDRSHLRGKERATPQCADERVTIARSRAQRRRHRGTAFAASESGEDVVLCGHPAERWAGGGYEPQ